MSESFWMIRFPVSGVFFTSTSPFVRSLAFSAEISWITENALAPAFFSETTILPFEATVTTILNTLSLLTYPVGAFVSFR